MTRVSDDIGDRVRAGIQKITTEKNNPKRDWFDKILQLAQAASKREQLNILEIGSGLGAFVHYANSRGHQVQGTESTKAYAEAVTKEISGTVHYVASLEYDALAPPGGFDLIYMEHVLEHIRVPDKLLGNLRPLLSAEGVLVLAVPNIDSVPARLFGVSWSWANPPEHLYFYGRRSLKILLERSGFAVRGQWCADYFHRSIYQFYSFGRLVQKVRSLSNKFLGTNLPRRNHAYRYPRRISEIVTLTPYWVMFPFLKFMESKGGGNELVVVAGRSVSEEA